MNLLMGLLDMVKKDGSEVVNYAEFQNVNWRNIGDNEGNTSIINSFAVNTKAAVKKIITNGVDAVI